VVVGCRDPGVRWVLGGAGQQLRLGGRFRNGLTGAVKNLLQRGARSVCICNMKRFKTRIPILLIISVAEVSPSFLSNILLHRFLSLLYGPPCPISFLWQCKVSLALQERKPTSWQ